MHLDGRVCLAFKPDVITNGCNGTETLCSWGGFDLDVYVPQTVQIVQEEIAVRFPFLLTDRTKSGGLHGFVFLDTLRPKQQVQAQLRMIVCEIGVPECEIFPSDRVREGKEPYGIALPFFGDRDAFEQFTPTTYSGPFPPVFAPRQTEKQDGSDPTKYSLKLGVTVAEFEKRLGEKANFRRSVDPDGGTSYYCHGVRGKEGTQWAGKPQPCFIEGIVHLGREDNARQFRFHVTKDARIVANCFENHSVEKGKYTLTALIRLGLQDLVDQYVRRSQAPDGAWDNPLPLGDDMPAVQPFTLDFLPKSFLPLVKDVSERMQTPMDYAAASVIVALAGCVNRRAVMQPKAEDTSWHVIPNLWGAIIAPPGLMKSPVQQQMTKPLTGIEEIWRANFQQEEEAYELEKERADLRKQAWKEKTKESYKRKAPEPTPPEQPRKPPLQKRLVLTDATFEKLHEILAENPAGVLVLRDELTGWLATLEKPGREGERAFYLQAWNGDTGYSMDRIGRGSIYVPAVCVSLLGNIQPARLRWYLSDAVAGGPNDDGLFQRFQILVWPDPPRDWTLIDRPPNSLALAKAEKVFSALANLPADPPVPLRFDCDGQKLFFEWLAELESKVRGECGLHPAIVAHLSKYRSLMPSLAALFELADRAAGDDGLAGKITVSVEHAKQAAVLCDYLLLHARRVYACVVSPQCRAARELARHIKAGDLSNPFKTRDVYLKGWSGLDDAERVRSAIELLEDAAWVRREESPKSQSGGRPTETWRINPKVARHEK
jgi:putative DNA primase/helicase